MFDLDTCVAFITNQAAKKIADAFNKRLLTKNLTRVQWIALYFLGKYDKLNQKTLANLMNLKESTVARLIDRMEKDELLVRTKDSEDKRTILLYLTEKGVELRENTLDIGIKMSQDIAKSISSEELEIFKNVLSKMVDNVKEETD